MQLHQLILHFPPSPRGAATVINRAALRHHAERDQFQFYAPGLFYYMADIKIQKLSCNFWCDKILLIQVNIKLFAEGNTTDGDRHRRERL